jgi:hypothetical protein
MPQSQIPTINTTTSITSHPIQEMKARCIKLAEVDVNKPNELASVLWGMSVCYYEDVRRQAQKSFYSALGVAVLGMIFFYYALYLMMHDKLQEPKFSLIAGTLTQIISGIMFYLYAQTSKQLFSFHVCLERANRFLLNNAMCDSLTEGKDEMRQELIRIIATAPVLSRALVEDGEICKEANHGSPDKKENQKATLLTIEEAPPNGTSHQTTGG